MLTKKEDDLVGLFGSFSLDGSPMAIPLKGVRVHADVHDFIAEVKVTQCFQSTQADSPMQCTYFFPLDDKAAVCGFEATYEDGTVVKGKVKEKNEAVAEFKQATRQGKQANLLEQVKPDIFSLKVGNLPPGEFVNIVLTYVTTLEARDDAAALIVPTHVAPRYGGGVYDLSSSEAAKIPSPVKPLFGFAINARFTCKSCIRTISSPTHEGSHSMQGTTGSFQLRNVTMDRDLVVLCQEENAHQPRVSVEVKQDGSKVGLVSIFPSLEFRDRPREFVFLLDRSGSMGTRANGPTQIEQAKQALQLFLRALPLGCSFNVVSFGSHFESLFPRQVFYNEETLETASNQVASMQADLGGTDISGPLQHIFQQSDNEKQIFVLTDGQVSNDKDVFRIIRTYCYPGRSSRLFCVGVGANVSRHLCNGMARAGRGTVRFVEEGENLQSKLMGQLKQALQPALDNVSVKWDVPTKEIKAVTVEQQAPVKTLLGYRSPSLDNPALDPDVATEKEPRIFPASNRTLFNKERLLSFAIFPPGSEMPRSVALSCMTEDGLLETTLPVTENDIFRGSVAHKLAARVAIKEYEDSNKDRKHHRYRSLEDSPNASILSRAEALEMALANSLASELTSFIAISDEKVVGGEANVARKREQDETISMESRMRAAMRETMRKKKACRRRAPSPNFDRAKSLFASGVDDESDEEEESDGDVAKMLAASMARKGKKMKRAKAHRKSGRWVGESLGPSATPFSTRMDEDELAADQVILLQSMAIPINQEVRQENTLLGAQQQMTLPMVNNRRAQEPLQLCLLQKANGSFALDQKLLSTVGVSRTALEELQHGEFAAWRLSDEVLATLLAVATLRCLFENDRSIWELSEEKALEYVKKNGGALDVDQALSVLESKFFQG